MPEAVREIVLQGRGTMPAVPLSEEELEAKWEKSFSHRLGMWSIEHTPKGWE